MKKSHAALRSLVVAALLIGFASAAHAAIPTTTDEARALAGSQLSRGAEGAEEKRACVTREEFARFQAQLAERLERGRDGDAKESGSKR